MASSDGLRLSEEDLYELEEKRLIVRRWLVDYGVIAPARANLALINEDGIDSDIDAMCALTSH